MHVRLCLVAVVVLCNCQSAVSKLPSFGPFQRLFRRVRHEQGTSDKTDASNVPASLVPVEKIMVDDHTGQMKIGKRILATISESPRLQELILVLTNRIINYGLFFLAFRMISRSFAKSIVQFTNDWTAMKEATRATTNYTQFVAPNTTLNSYEEEILNTLVVPTSIESGMQDIGGLGTVKAMLADMFQPPRSQHNESGSQQQQLMSPVQSLLLYGPPGCGELLHTIRMVLSISLYFIAYVVVVIVSGKSMLARALCRQLNVPMLTIMPSLLLRMYVGETSRLTKALFTLARKMQPCLVFIDEADALFSARNTQGGHQVDRQLLTECKGSFPVYCLFLHCFDRSTCACVLVLPPCTRLSRFGRSIVYLVYAFPPRFTQQSCSCGTSCCERILKCTSLPPPTDHRTWTPRCSDASSGPSSSARRTTLDARRCCRLSYGTRRWIPRSTLKCAPDEWTATLRAT